MFWKFLGAVIMSTWVGRKMVLELAGECGLMRKSGRFTVKTEAVTEPLEGYNLHGISGSEWDSPVTNVYVVDNQNDGSFVITEKYFLEAAEGHGARFYAMLQEFEIME